MLASFGFSPNHSDLAQPASLNNDENNNNVNAMDQTPQRPRAQSLFAHGR